jgi:hypothetical protein
MFFRQVKRLFFQEFYKLCLYVLKFTDSNAILSFREEESLQAAQQKLATFSAELLVKILRSSE